jgi:hypothetical protein
MAYLSKEFVSACFNEADGERSKLMEQERLNNYGFSSIKLRAFLNNLCSKDKTTYLEIGLYRGSTFISALYQNKGISAAVGVENFKYDDREPTKFRPQGWSNVKSHLYDILDKYKFNDAITDKLTILDMDFQAVEWEAQPKFNVVFFDVSPISPAIYKTFFDEVTKALSTNAVLVFSQFSSEKNALMLEEAIEKASDKITVEYKFSRISNSNADAYGYYSGILVLGVKKKVFAKNA